MPIQIPFAINDAGQLVSIAQVERGIACACTCPGCGQPVIARQGKINIPHFAHASDANCPHGYETAIHLAVKAYLTSEKKLFLPPCYAVHVRFDDEIQVSYPKTDPRVGYPSQEAFDYVAGTTGVGEIAARLITFDQVIEEKAVGDIRPDMIGVFNGKPIYIEVAVTHFVDEAKLQKLKARRVSTIELDFSGKRLWTWGAIGEFLREEVASKTWLLNAVADSKATDDRLARESRTRAQRHAQSWPVTHSSEFTSKAGTRISVFLCPGYVGIKVIGQVKGNDVELLTQAATNMSADVIDKNIWGVRPPSEHTFLKIEAYVREYVQAVLAQWAVLFPQHEIHRAQELLTKGRLRKQSPAIT